MPTARSPPGATTSTPTSPASRFRTGLSGPSKAADPTPAIPGSHRGPAAAPGSVGALRRHRLDIRHPDVALVVEVLGRLLVAGHLRVDVGIGKADHAHVLEGRAQLGAPQPDVTQDRHDAHEQEVAEFAP